MEIGVSTACLYPLETELSLQTVAELGVRTVEIFINAPSEIKPECLARLKETADACHIKIASLHPYSSGFEPFLFFTGYDRRYRDGLAMYDEFYQAAAMLGAGIVVLHGDHRGGLLPEEEYFERFGEMFRRAAAQGVVLAQENVERCRSRSSGFIHRMKNYLADDVRFVLDLKQALRSGEDIFGMLEAMGDKVCHLHLSDSRGEETCLPPGQGSFDFEVFAKRLQALHYAGCGVIELYRDNYRKPEELYQSYCYLQAIPGIKLRQNSTEI